jgi:hypothetical protein
VVALTTGQNMWYSGQPSQISFRSCQSPMPQSGSWIWVRHSILASIGLHSVSPRIAGTSLLSSASAIQRRPPATCGSWRALCTRPLAPRPCSLASFPSLNSWWARRCPSSGRCRRTGGAGSTRRGMGIARMPRWEAAECGGGPESVVV